MLSVGALDCLFGSNMVLSCSDLQGDDLGMKFAKEDVGSTVVATGKIAVSPVHYLQVSIPGLSRNRPAPVLPVQLSRNSKQSLLGCSYLLAARAYIMSADAKILTAKK